MEDEEAVTFNDPRLAIEGFRTLRQMDQSDLDDPTGNFDEDDSGDWDFSSD